MPIPSEGAGRTVQPDDERYYFPTPLVEIITNPGVNN